MDPIPLPTDTTPLILRGDTLATLARLPADSVHCVVTSYPYWGLRDYGRCPCSVQRVASEASLEMAGTVDEGVSGQIDPDDPRCAKEPDPHCPDCRGTGRIEMETVWGEPPGGCAHEWEVSHWYWDNRHASVLAAEGRDDLGSKKDARGKTPSTTCRLCGAWKGAFGLEPTVGLYVVHAVEIGRQIRRVLRPDGTLWLNLGDSYAGGGRGGGVGANGKKSMSASQYWEQTTGSSLSRSVPKGLKPKDLVGVPWRVAFAYQDDGWYLRCDVVWGKPNPMPEPVRDRPSRNHEYVFLLTKSARYFYDGEAVRTPLSESTAARWRREDPEDLLFNPSRHKHSSGIQTPMEVKVRATRSALDRQTALLKSVWWISSQPYPEAHFATFPESLVETCIKAGTSEVGACSVCGTPWRREVRAEGGTIGKDWHPDKSLDKGRVQGIADPRSKDATYKRVDLGFRPGCAHVDAPKVPCVVLEPFLGSGTTAAVARRLGRRSVGVDLNPAYVRLASDRVGRFRDILSWAESK